MGGRALKNTATRRYRADEYEVLTGEVCLALRHCLPDLRIAPVVSYASKPDHGDLDVVVENTDAKRRLESALEGMGVVEVVRNGPVWSVGWGDFQVDLLFQPPEDFSFAERYFAYNDLGNLIGRTAHRLGLKFGHNGLRYVLRDGSYKVAELVLTRDFAEALCFLGFEARRHAEGFATLEDVFRYAASSPYFEPEAFLMENRPHRARIRDAKRPTYTKFLAHLKAEQVGPGAKAGLGYLSHLERARKRFPAFAAELAGAEAEHARRKSAKAVFNGVIVAGLTGLEGKSLGAFMRELQRDTETHGGDLYGWVLAATPGQRTEWVKDRLKGHERVCQDGERK